MPLDGNQDNQTQQYDTERIMLRLQSWQEKLLDMSKSNPLLGLNRSRAAKLRIIEPIQEVFSSLVVDEDELKLPLVRRIFKKTEQQNLLLDANTDQQPKESYEYVIDDGDINFEKIALPDLRRKIKRIYDNSRTTMEERGVITLYLAMGSLKWADDVLGESISPIVLIPCELKSKGPNTGLRLHIADDEIVFNPALTYYLREKHKISLPEIFAEPSVGALTDLLASVEKSVSDHNWSVEECAWIGTFSFESLAIYQDLKQLTGTACQSKLIAALCKARPVNEESEALGDDLDEMDSPEKVPVPCLETDSSQLKALSYAAANDNLVLHGPPGTGKSQTISNIIADALGRGQKVLFVSAKMAALNVVFERLKAIGLEQFCLEAHSTKAGKLKIIEDLKKTIDSDGFSGVEPITEELNKLKSVRTELNDYVKALHTKNESLGITPYEAIGKYVKLQNYPEVKFQLPWQDATKATSQELNERITALDEIAEQHEIFNQRATHPWRGFTYPDFNIQIQEEIESDLRYLQQSATDLQPFLKNITPLLSLPQNVSFNELRYILPLLNQLSKIDNLPKFWHSKKIELLKETEKKLSEGEIKAAAYFDLKLHHKEVTDLSEADLKKLLLDARSRYDTWYKRLSVPYLVWLYRAIKPILKENTDISYQSLLKYYDNADEIEKIQNWFDDFKEDVREELGENELIDKDLLCRIKIRFSAAIQLRTYLDNFNRAINFSEAVFMSDVSNSAAAVTSFFASQKDTLDNTAKRIDQKWESGIIDGQNCLNCSLTKLIQHCDEICGATENARSWVILQRSIKSCENLGLKPLLESIGDQNSELISKIFQRRFYKIFADTSISNSRGLFEFTSFKRKDQIHKLKKLDAKIRELSMMQTKATISRSVQRVKSAGFVVGNASEIGTLRVEMQKSRRIKPLRRLFSEIPHVLQAIKPCMLMSPISVSTYLKPGVFDFDVVIFDEASQLPTAEAVPSVLRAKQVIVAGDCNQLPPTSFFRSTLTEDDIEDEDESPNASQVSLESLLDDCVASVPAFRETYLKWHYRSRDERLIKFSNHYFYNNNLITFPSNELGLEGRGVKLEYVANGIWDRGRSRTNRQEARRVANLVIDNFEKDSKKSIGVVAFNTYQREAIEDAIQEELQEKPHLNTLFDSTKKEPFFVKSLENVQGDERDIIIISVGYGKDGSGNPPALNFGPINSEGGWRRLNVLVTRAKWQTILVTSLRSTDLSRVNPDKKGAMALRNFIEYAEREGKIPAEPATSTQVETNDFEDMVRCALIERGYNVDAQVGAGGFRIDLAVRDPRDPNRYLIGIECDGATYHSSRIARDRDILRQEILESMGWRLCRVWSTEWFNSPDLALKSMINTISAAMNKDIEKSIQAITNEKEREVAMPKQTHTPEIIINKKYKAGIEYKKYATRHYNINLGDERSYSSLAEAILEIIREEGPIHRELLDDRVRDSFKIGRIGSSIRKNIERSLRKLSKDEKIKIKDDFIYNKAARVDKFRLPANGTKRTIRFIAPEELGMAILYIVEDQFGIDRDQIPRSIAKLFGIERMAPEEADAIREEIDYLIEKGLLRINGPRVVIVE